MAATRGSMRRPARLAIGAVLALIAGITVGFRGVAPGAPSNYPLTPFVDALPIPPLVDATAGGVVDLRLVEGTHSFSPGNAVPATTTWGYTAQYRNDALEPLGAPAGLPYLGPTLEVRRGTPISVRAFNELGDHPATAWCPPAEAGCDSQGGAIDLSLHGATPDDVVAPRAAIHKHGGHVTADADGGPLDTFRPSASAAPDWTYRYDNDQEATTLWYHDHALGITRLNVVAGLAGFYLVRDAYDTGRPGNPLELPSLGYEFPVVLQDRLLRADGSVSYPPGELQPWSPEYFGDVSVVNSVVSPFKAVEPRIYRVRLLNGSNARVYRLALDDKGQRVAMYQIGTDGGLLSSPVRLSQLLLAPGERADVLLDFRRARPGDRINVTNNAPTPFPDGARAARRGGAPLRQIMQFQVTAAAAEAPGAVSAVPATLRGPGKAPALPSAAALVDGATRVRNVFLNEILDPATGVPLEVLLNNSNFHAVDEQSALQERPAADTVEVWNIINASADTHPIHLHLAQFQLVQRQAFDPDAYIESINAMLKDAGLVDPSCSGLPDPCAAGVGPPYLDGEGRVEPPDADPTGAPVAPPANEVGWKDTVQANPGEVTTIVVPFGGDSLASKLGLGAAALPYTESWTGDYVFHCHILEHEDNEMMLPYTVE